MILGVRTLARRMARALCPLLVFALAGSSNARADEIDVCLEFLEAHIDDPGWMDACVDALVALAGAPALGSSALEASAQSNALLGSSEGLSCASNVNMSRLLDSQQEVSIAIDPNDPNRLFAFSNSNPPGTGLFAAFSSDGGASWTKLGDGKIADGGGDPLPLANVDPWTSWDEFGNLFLTYFSFAGPAPIALSTNGGQSFAQLTSPGGEPVALGTHADRPVIAAGAGSVWVAYMEGLDTPIVQGAPVTGLGAVGAFQAPQVIDVGTPPNRPRSPDLAIGPGGQILLSYQEPVDPDALNGPDDIFVALDGDGLGSDDDFTAPRFVTRTNVGISETGIPPGPQLRITATPGLSYDLSNGPHRGRVYLAYTDEVPDESENTDIFVVFSDENFMPEDGSLPVVTPIRVNDDGTQNSQILPRIAVDSTSGVVAVSWHDAREDAGNVATRMYAAISVDGGQSFLPSVPVSSGSSNQTGPPMSDYGDYTGLAFSRGRLHPAWGDNSNSTLDNPNGALSLNDAYTATCTADADLDGVLDTADNCVRVANAAPNDCDTDEDGYGNYCDGDFNQSWIVDATDFTVRFLPDFKAGTDLSPIDGTDMNCVGGVNTTDFSTHFIPSFKAGKPGPSGLFCAGSAPCNL